MPAPDNTPGPTHKAQLRAANEAVGGRGNPDPTAPTPARVGPVIGGTIGRYKLLELLGGGGFGRVFKAFDPDLQREVAIKVPAAAHVTAEVRDVFLREARSAAAVHHPSVCPIYDVGADNGLPYIVMRYIPTGTLAGMLARRRGLIPPRHAAAIARRLALGAAAAHARGVVHRDLKAQNVLWDEPLRQVLLTDFGLARVVGETTLNPAGHPMGTPGYMAPEQARGEADKVGPLSDVFALGVILYEMLAGRLPFEASWPGYLWQVTQTTPPAPSAARPGLDPRLDAVCRKAMATRPADRYPTARDLAEALTAVLGDDAGGESGELVFAEEIAEPARRPPPPPAAPPEAISCPKCRATLQVAAGRTKPVTCPLCRLRFVPAAGRKAAPPQSVVALAGPVRARRRVIGWAVVALLIAGGVAAVLLSDPPGPGGTARPAAPTGKSDPDPAPAKADPPADPVRASLPAAWKEYVAADGSFTARFPAVPDRVPLTITKVKTGTAVATKAAASPTSVAYATKGDHPAERCVVVVVKFSAFATPTSKETQLAAAVRAEARRAADPPPTAGDGTVKTVDWLGEKAKETDVNPGDPTAPHARLVTRQVAVGAVGVVAVYGVRDGRGPDLAPAFFESVRLPAK